MVSTGNENLPARTGKLYPMGNMWETGFQNSQVGDFIQSESASIRYGTAGASISPRGLLPTVFRVIGSPRVETVNRVPTRVLAHYARR